MLLHNKRQHKTRQHTIIGKSFALFYEYAKQARIREVGGGGGGLAPYQNNRGKVLGLGFG